MYFSSVPSLVTTRRLCRFPAACLFLLQYFAAAISEPWALEPARLVQISVGARVRKLFVA
jgi:hypothetical protein